MRRRDRIKAGSARSQILIGLALAVAGGVLLLRAGDSLRLLSALAAASLLGLGALRLRSATRSTSRITDSVVGGVCVLAAIAVLAWPDATPRLLAAMLAVALLAHSATQLRDGLRTKGSQRWAELLSGLTALLFVGLVVAWPKLSLYVLDVLFGGWLVFTGLSLMARALRRPKTPPIDGSPRPHLLRSALSLLLALALVGVTVLAHGGDADRAPDAFYTPPAHTAGTPGTLIRSEPLTTGVPAGTQAWRLLYITSQPDGTPAVASGTVIAPRQLPVGPRPVIAVAHGTTGVQPKCAPSRSPTPFSDGASSALTTMVKDGWVGVMTDYVGLGTSGPHPYLVGPAEARNVLDALRAARELPTLELSRKTVVWGHSQGGHAALWTGITAPSYAPDVDVLGVAAFSPVTDMVALEQGIKDKAAGKILMSYIAALWDQVYPREHVLDQITPGYKGLVTSVAGRCFGGRDAIAAFATTSQMFSPVFPQRAIDDGVGKLMRANTPNAKIAAPVLVAQGGADALVLPDMQRRWVKARCNAGQHLDYREYAGLDHVPVVAADSPLTPALITWTQDRLDAKPPTPTC